MAFSISLKRTYSALLSLTCFGTIGWGTYCTREKKWHTQPSNRAEQNNLVPLR
ncbi:uncharacterized protein BT62DRAFT_95228 [Guyanagaster necrorhizus]|uniref:Uncharacterized protein n=1 Tax=Guyanagaster necrorhizus TaxID=856835 RepID=A0A9P7VVK6_9AGAR|nr:uncharacterized protein BT62DRAFT_95228 [Guyanagaster necrorhizus MCA 3950]KAG7446969.1 hypothetical protein BT62DRAFT_95228 [Guyanagaster necrorhizus MCA 3950]